MAAQGLHLAVKNDLAEVASVTESMHVFSAQLGLSHEIDYALQLVVEELLANIIMYGYTNDDLHTITIDVQANSKEVCLLVRDDGKQFNLLERPIPQKPASLEEASLGGLGILLVRGTMDEISYRYDDGRNSISLKKRVNPSIY